MESISMSEATERISQLRQDISPEENEAPANENDELYEESPATNYDLAQEDVGDSEPTESEQQTTEPQTYQPSQTLGIANEMPVEQVEANVKKFEADLHGEFRRIKNAEENIGRFIEQAEVYRHSNPAEYAARMAEANNARHGLQQHVSQMRQVEARARTEATEYIATERKKLHKARPWMKDESKVDDFFHYVQHERGVDPKSVERMTDPRELAPLLDLYENHRGIKKETIPRRNNGQFKSPKAKPKAVNNKTSVSLSEGTAMLSKMLRERR